MCTKDDTGHKDILANRANLSHENAQVQSCDSCDNYLVFAMKDGYHSFSLGLSTILECLQLAEQQGHVPQLPPQWWAMIQNRFEQMRRL